MLNASSGFLQDDPFDIVSENGSHIPYFNPSIGQSNIFLFSIRPLTFELTSSSSSISTGPLTEDPSNSNRPTKVNHGSHVSCLPRWVSNIIEAVGTDAGDYSSGRKTRSQKKHANVALMNRVLETYDVVTYSDVEG
jgi:hypothetical protein